jgi:polyphosphate glucokinase
MAKKTTDPATGRHTALGIDVGGTGMKGGVVQLGAGPASGTLVGDRYRIPTPQPADPVSVAGVLARITAELDTRDGAPPRDLAVGVDFPAVIQEGVCRTATNIDPSWIGTDVDALFSEHLKRPVTTLNDADAAGLAEVRFGAGRGVQGTVLVITLGTGIGAGLFRDGELVPNLELGTIELDGVVAESRASAAAREREGLDWPEYAERLQRYFSYVEGIVYPDLFIVGGGISKRPNDYLPLLSLRTPIVPASLRNNAGIVGAALWATDVLARTPVRRRVVHTARTAADQELARHAQAEETAGAAPRTEQDGPQAMRNQTDRKAKKTKTNKQDKEDKKARKPETASPDRKAEKKAAQESRAIAKAMDKAIRRSSR